MRDLVNFSYNVFLEVEFRFSDPSKVYSEDRANDSVCVEMIPPSGGLDRSITVTVQKQSSG